MKTGHVLGAVIIGVLATGIGCNAVDAPRRNTGVDGGDRGTVGAGAGTDAGAGADAVADAGADAGVVDADAGLVVVTSLPTEVRASGPFAWWRFDDLATSSAAWDATGNGLDGAYSQSGVTRRAPHLGAGDTAALFDGASETRVTVANDARLSPSSITIEALVRIDRFSGQMRIIERSRSQTTGTQPQYGLNVVEATRAVFFEVRTQNAGLVSVTGRTRLPINTPVHLAATYDGSVARVYVNGALDGETTTAGGPIDATTTALGIGNQVERGRPFAGTIDEVALYSRALPESEVAAHARAMGPAAPTTLAISTTTLPAGTEYMAYSVALRATGGHGAYTWSLNGAAAPAGLTLDATTGVLSGTPTAAGSYTLTVRVSDAATPAQTATATLALSIARFMCPAGSFLSGPGACTTCRLTCGDGYYQTGSCDGTGTEGSLSCAACTLTAPVEGCTRVSCMNAADARCTACAPGRYLSASGTCDTCTALPNCETTVCAAANASRCQKCDPGYFIDLAGGCSPCRTTCAASGEVVSGSCDGTTLSDVTNCAALPNILNNASFEEPDLETREDLLWAPGSRFSRNFVNTGLVPSWRVTGDLFYLIKSGTASKCYGGACPAPNGDQYVLLGTDSNSHTAVEQFRSDHSIEAGRVFTFSVDVQSIAQTESVYPCDASISLTAVRWGSGETRPLATASLCRGAFDTWRTVSVSFNSADLDVPAAYWLSLTILQKRGRMVIDRASLVLDAVRRAASGPSPQSGATGVHRDIPALTWRAVDGATDYRVCLGTNRADVQNAATASCSGMATNLGHAPGRLIPGATYYWRVDSIGGGASGNSRGPVWSFTVTDAKASNPRPASDSNGVNPDIVLRFTPGPYATEHQVYFGTDRALVAARDAQTDRGRVTSNDFNPGGGLTPGQTYYWAVDAIAGAERWEGDVWSFVVYERTGLPADFAPGYAVRTATSMMRVFPAASVASFAQDAKRIRLELGRGEYESQQIVVFPATGHRLDRVRVEASALAGPAGSAATPEVTMHAVGYLKLPARGAASQYDPWLGFGVPALNAAGWWPDLLLPARAVDIAPGHAQPFWVTVHAPHGTSPGEYRGTLTVRTDTGGSFDVPLEIVVLDLEVPKGAGRFRAVGDLYIDPERMTAGDYQVFAETLLAHRVNPDNVYRNDVPLVPDLEHFFDLGMNAFNILRDNWRSNGQPYEPRFNTTNTFLASVAASAYPRALRSMAYFYGFDEIGSDRFPSMRAEFGLLHERFPGIPTMTTSHIYTPSENPAWTSDPVGQMESYNIDRVCTATYNAAEANVIRDRYNLGKENWNYGEWPVRHPLTGQRALGWRHFRLKTDGYLNYSVNTWTPAEPQNANAPIDPEAGVFSNFAEVRYSKSFAAVQLFPGVRGADGRLTPIATSRLHAIRDGLEDYEYLWQLEQRVGGERAMDIASRVALSANDYSNPSFDPAVIAAARRTVIAELLRADSVIQNGSFESGAIAPWTNVGSGWSVEDVADASHGGRVVRVSNSLLSQRVGTIQAGTRYAVIVDVRPNPTGGTGEVSGTISLRAGGQVLAQSGDVRTLPSGRWSSIAATFDSATAALRVGDTLDVVIEITAGVADLDDVRLTQGARKARDPEPANGATNVSRETGLIFTPSGDSSAMKGQRVYFGTDRTAVENGDVSVDRGLASVGRWFPPAELAAGTTYYWRVDTVRHDAATNTTTLVARGDVWSFSVSDGRAHSPTPATGAAVADLDGGIRWMPGEAAIEHRVYLATAQAALSQEASRVDAGASRKANRYQPATTPGTTYVWRVDEVADGGAVTQGNVWTFTTAP